MPDPMTPPPLSAKEARLQRTLKVIVAVLGIAILVVLGIMVTAIVGGGRDRAADQAADRAPSSAGDAPTVASFAERELRLPPGAAVVDMTVGEGVLAVRYRTSTGAEEIALLDTGTGVLRGRIKVIVEPGRTYAPVAD